MTRLSIVVGLVCLLAMLIPGCAPAPEPEATPEPMFDQAAEEAAIRAATERIHATYKEKDLKAFVACFDEDYETWTGRVKGRVGIEEGAAKEFEQSKDGQMEVVQEIGVVFVTPDVAIHKYRDEESGFADEGPQGKRLAARLYVKKNGQWLCAAFFYRYIEEE